MSLARVVRFDTARYRFAEIASADVFEGHALSRLHDVCEQLTGQPLTGGQPTLAQSLSLRQRLARQRDEAVFYRTYHRFINDVVALRYGGKISYSAHPTFRVHLAGSPAVSKWHRDVDVTGREDQINAWVPFVDVEGANSLWIEQDYGTADYAPVSLRYGEMLLFDGGLLSHGSVTNTSDVTRVGMDFRFAPKRGIAEGFDILAAR